MTSSPCEEASAFTHRFARGTGAAPPEPQHGCALTPAALLCLLLWCARTLLTVRSTGGCTFNGGSLSCRHPSARCGLPIGRTRIAAGNTLPGLQHAVAMCRLPSCNAAYCPLAVTSIAACGACLHALAVPQKIANGGA
jgi:hypothetical protein